MTGDHKCILVGMLLYFLQAGIRRFVITCGEFEEGKMAMEGVHVNCIHGGSVNFVQ